MHKPVLGILGGVGPLATAYFMELLIKKTPARTDQDHMPMIVFNDPQIPDRTAYILDHSKPNPRPEMAKVARWLQEAGADYIAIACNTAHYFYDDINEAVEVPASILSGGTICVFAMRLSPSASSNESARSPPFHSGTGKRSPSNSTFLPEAKNDETVESPARLTDRAGAGEG